MRKKEADTFFYFAVTADTVLCRKARYKLHGSTFQVEMVNSYDDVFIEPPDMMVGSCQSHCTANTIILGLRVACSRVRAASGRGGEFTQPLSQKLWDLRYMSYCQSEASLSSSTSAAETKVCIEAVTYFPLEEENSSLVTPYNK